MIMIIKKCSNHVFCLRPIFLRLGKRTMKMIYQVRCWHTIIFPRDHEGWPGLVWSIQMNNVKEQNMSECWRGIVVSCFHYYQPIFCGKVLTGRVISIIFCILKDRWNFLLRSWRRLGDVMSPNFIAKKWVQM